MTIAEFIAKWRKVELKERSAAQEHFLDLCAVFDHPTPAAADPTGESFCFEKGAAKHGPSTSSGQAALGFADVWKRGHFGWEYKGKHKDLSAAYDQLLRYRDALENPPLLVMCDLDRIIVRTNFTGTVSAKHEIPLEALGQPRNIDIMRAVFHDPEALRPGRTSTAITQDAARQFADIAAILRDRGHEPATVAHFLDRIVFCLFAEDTGLLPEKVFTRILDKSGGDTTRLSRFLGQLFETMATGGDFGLETIRHFNGSLFDDPAVLDLTTDDVKRIRAAAALDWSAVDPSIFGTLFERGLDPAKRSQLGAHFTSREDIELVVDAVVMTPLRREWDDTRVIIENLLTTGRKHPAAGAKAKVPTGPALKKARSQASVILHNFLVEVQRVKVLDPACGSGNFLYMALLRLKDLEKEIILYGSDNDLGAYLPLVGPWQLYGIEINPYAHDLAQMTVWIGWLQWIRANGFGFPADPILRPLSDNIRLMDAIVEAAPPPRLESGEDAASTVVEPACREPAEPDWPAVDFIIGNPPFLGGKLLRRELGDAYVDRMFTVWSDRVPREADLCCYWFEKARAHIAAGKVKRVGLLATQGIRGGANREVLKRIKETGDIFWAESDRPWILDGANVHVSMVGFDDGTETSRTLDGRPVETINANLTATADIGAAERLADNAGIGFMGTTKQGPFDIPESLALTWLNAPNPHGRPNSDVLAPWINGMAVTKRTAPIWIIDFFNMPESNAALYETPFAYCIEHVKKAREANPRDWFRPEWWQLYAQRPEMRSAMRGSERYIVTPRVAKHRLFVWQSIPTNPDSAVIAFTRDDDTFFGILHSRFHEVWALAQGTQLREKESGFRYTPTTCFETFPFPPGCGTVESGTGSLPGVAASRSRVSPVISNKHGQAAHATSRDAGQSGTGVPPVISKAHGQAAHATIGTVRYPRLVPRDETSAAKLKKRTLTNLYNERPAWLADSHARLDAAVAAAYGWPADLSDEAILERLLALNLERAGK